jgi:hypothetical protein
LRIQARAVRRCGELLEQFQTGPKGGRPKGNGGDASPVSQRDAAAAAGLSKDQEKQAVRVANVPAAEFEAAVECDDPPTVTALAERGTAKRPPKPEPPPGVQDATHLTGLLRELAAFCETHQAPAVVVGLFSHEMPMLHQRMAVIGEWLTGFRHAMEARDRVEVH